MAVDGTKMASPSLPVPGPKQLSKSTVHSTQRESDKARKLAGYAVGAVGTIISNPADNIVSSVYNKKSETVKQALHLSEISQTFSDILLVNLFRSLLVRKIIVGPIVTLQWFFYDTIKVLSGL
ncbi:mitochondrial phosphate carrier 1, mitochondrial [Olea europaea subsp. europaea]|uniref:Mitochondrial phosphate carrier 1, mitochondrial n=1 Tax=Olea europaea subsp. europaea TaxID=158383 RepID=A0A8S0QSE6_OLEEU|nr:mitochondrial phosphate carrier 1, mitochondrial [Olea europaea subsp. europaea]